jgi:hypothetical protein
VCTGLVTVTVGARDARIAADPADFAGAQSELLGQPLAWQLQLRQRDAVSAFTA